MFFLKGVGSFAQAQGPRDYQEDHMICLQLKSKRNGTGYLLGVMDGHEGEEVAKYCSETIPSLFDPEAWDIEQELRGLVKRLDIDTRTYDMGSTLSLAHVNESKNIVTTVVLGDSPIIVVDSSGSIQRSVEHNVRSNLLERHAAVRRGAIYLDDGYIIATRHGDGLQLSRALGDHGLRNILDRTPVICSYKIGANSLVIVSSDGLFDASHEDSCDDTILALISAVRDGGGAAEVLRLKETEGLNDNTSVVVWRAEE